MPTYRVDRPGQKPRIVDASTPAGARAHVAASEIKVSKITASDAFKLAQDGAKLEVAGETPPEPEAGEPAGEPASIGAAGAGQDANEKGDKVK